MCSKMRMHILKVSHPCHTLDNNVARSGQGDAWSRHLRRNGVKGHRARLLTVQRHVLSSTHSRHSMTKIVTNHEEDVSVFLGWSSWPVISGSKFSPLLLKTDAKLRRSGEFEPNIRRFRISVAIHTNRHELLSHSIEK